jgi:hypothetical protein
VAVPALANTREGGERLVFGGTANNRASAETTGAHAEASRQYGITWLDG